MAAVKQVCHDFTETTTIKGIYSISKHSKTQTFFKYFLVIVATGLFSANAWQSYVSVKKHFNQPTAIKIKLDYHPLTFPAVTFCSAKPYVSELLKTSTPQLFQIEKNLHNTLYGIANVSDIKQVACKKRNAVNQRPNDWIQVGGSCYYRPRLLKKANDSISFCANLNSTLPIFYNASEFLAFTNWWNVNASNSEVWLGLTYGQDANAWYWLNNGTWKHFPSFWRICWDKTCGFANTTFYSKYSNKPKLVYASTGVEPVSEDT